MANSPESSDPHALTARANKKNRPAILSYSFGGATLSLLEPRGIAEAAGQRTGDGEVREAGRGGVAS